VELPEKQKGLMRWMQRIPSISAGRPNPPSTMRLRWIGIRPGNEEIRKAADFMNQPGSWVFHSLGCEAQAVKLYKHTANRL
jgi:hypothetical protein